MAVLKNLTSNVVARPITYVVTVNKHPKTNCNKTNRHHLQCAIGLHRTAKNY